MCVCVRARERVCVCVLALVRKRKTVRERWEGETRIDTAEIPTPKVESTST